MPGKCLTITLSPSSLSDFYNITEGVFSPLNGFMTAHDYQNVVDNMRLSDGSPWTIPITLDLSECDAQEALKQKKVKLESGLGVHIGWLYIEDVYKVNFKEDIKKIFLTESRNHPGVTQELKRSPYRIGGKIKAITGRPQIKGYLSPAETKALFKRKKFKTITGFQTRNPIHMAHEYHQRTALDVSDGLFIQPIVGWKRAGDFSQKAVMSAYKFMVEHIYPGQRVVLGALDTPMRYAGPREAVFHALIRRNFGCTHFIVGRDHAGVGNYYGTYAAHKLVTSFQDLGINILALFEPYYCRKCGFIVNEKNCRHKKSHYEPISGSIIRQSINLKKKIPSYYMREEVLKILIDLNSKGNCFIEEEK